MKDRVSDSDFRGYDPKDVVGELRAMIAVMDSVVADAHCRNENALFLVAQAVRTLAFTIAADFQSRINREPSNKNQVSREDAPEVEDATTVKITT